MDASTNTYQRIAHRCANMGRHTPGKYVGQYGDRRKYMSCAQGGALQQETHNSPKRNHVPTNKQARGHAATPRFCLWTMYTAPCLRLGRSLVVASICCPTAIASSGPTPAFLGVANGLSGNHQCPDPLPSSRPPPLAPACGLWQTHSWNIGHCQIIVLAGWPIVISSSGAHHSLLPSDAAR